LKHRFSLAILCITVACLLAAPRMSAAAAADESFLLNMETLKKMGVDSRDVVLGGVSDDASIALASHKETDPKKIAKGQIWWLHFFRLDWPGKTANHDMVSLPLARVDQYAFAPDMKSVVVVGNGGTVVLNVNLASKQIRPIFKYEKGKPGFRIQPPTFWIEDGKLTTSGYFYNEDQFLTLQAAVSVDPNGSGLTAFTTVRDITGINETMKFYADSVWNSSTQAYFSLRESEKPLIFAIYAYGGDPSKMDLVDRGAWVDSMASGQDRVIYAVRQADGTSKTRVYEQGSKQSWQVGDGKSNYTYLYMSRDGSTALVCLLELEKRKMSTWYAHDSDKFRLHPMPGMMDVFPGTIRMAHTGKALSFFTDKGIYFRRIPAP